MNLFLDRILLDADGVYLGCAVHSNQDIYVIKDGDDVEYEAGVCFVLSEEDLWYNIEDGHTLTTKYERDILFKSSKYQNSVKEEFERHYLYFKDAKTPLHKRKTLMGVEIVVVNGDNASTKDLQYLVRSYIRHERIAMEVL